MHAWSCLTGVADSNVFRLEHSRLDPMALEQLVELGTVALCELCRLCDIALGDLQDAHQVVALNVRFARRARSAA